MYQREWDRLEEGLLKGLDSYIDKVQYIGALSKNIPQIACCEQVSSCVFHVKYNDTDYNQSAVMNIAVYITSENNVAVCEEKAWRHIGTIGVYADRPKAFLLFL